MRSITPIALSLLLGLSGCVTKFVDRSCQDRGYAPGSALYEACYPLAATAITQTYGEALWAPLQPPYLLAPPPP